MKIRALEIALLSAFLAAPTTSLAAKNKSDNPPAAASDSSASSFANEMEAGCPFASQSPSFLLIKSKITADLAASGKTNPSGCVDYNKSVTQAMDAAERLASAKPPAPSTTTSTSTGTSSASTAVTTTTLHSTTTPGSDSPTPAQELDSQYQFYNTLNHLTSDLVTTMNGDPDNKCLSQDLKVAFEQSLATTAGQMANAAASAANPLLGSLAGSLVAVLGKLVLNHGVDQTKQNIQHLQDKDQQIAAACLYYRFFPMVGQCYFPFEVAPTPQLPSGCLPDPSNTEKSIFNLEDQFKQISSAKNWNTYRLGPLGSAMNAQIDDPANPGHQIPLRQFMNEIQSYYGAQKSDLDSQRFAGDLQDFLGKYDALTAHQTDENFAALQKSFANLPNYWGEEKSNLMKRDDPDFSPSGLLFLIGRYWKDRENGANSPLDAISIAESSLRLKNVVMKQLLDTLPTLQAQEHELEHSYDQIQDYFTAFLQSERQNLISYVKGAVKDALAMNHTVGECGAAYENAVKACALLAGPFYFTGGLVQNDSAPGKMQTSVYASEHVNLSGNGSMGKINTGSGKVEGTSKDEYTYEQLCGELPDSPEMRKKEGLSPMNMDLIPNVLPDPMAIPACQQAKAAGLTAETLVDGTYGDHPGFRPPSSSPNRLCAFDFKMEQCQLYGKVDAIAKKAATDVCKKMAGLPMTNAEPAN